MITFFDILRSREFRSPLFILMFIAGAMIWDSKWLYLLALACGLGQLGWESWQRLRIKRWNLDYLAWLALGMAFGLQEFLAGAVIALMVAVSAALEAFGASRAEKTLRGLFEKIPKTVLVKTETGTREIPLQEAKTGDILIVRPNEMIPLDGVLFSTQALLNEANLTGEMEPVVYARSALLKSGFVNVGESLELSVRGDFEHSSYRKILHLVEEGKMHPSPIVRIAERYNILFTVVALTLAFGAVFFFGDWGRFLAVLVIATPCPLLIAAPIAFIGGLNKAARQNIIIKGPFVLELLAKTKVFFFDKTGTLTLGEPRLKRIEVSAAGMSEEQVFALAIALEWHSFHPIAKSFVKTGRERGIVSRSASDVEEKIGEGIRGTIDGETYAIVKATDISDSGIVVDLLRGNERIARFFFDDELKVGVEKVFAYLKERGYQLGILTGDRKANAERLFGTFGLPVYAECSPEKKTELVQRYQKEGKLVGMIGDGMNDAPALALADVGVVFSGTENSASIEAADVAILGRDAWRIRDAVHIGRRSYHVALQSILIGIGLSLIGMLAAFFGLISPVVGAILQELIDAVVIVNALRSTY